jgi:hypothetical protein
MSPPLVFSSSPLAIGTLSFARRSNGHIHGCPSPAIPSAPVTIVVLDALTDHATFRSYAIATSDGTRTLTSSLASKASLQGNNEWDQLTPLVGFDLTLLER